MSLDAIQLPLKGARLIEASAGTGKTFTLALLYLRLILGHGQVARTPLGVENILVLTFTKAATQELRDRIRARLAEAANAFFDPQQCQDPMLSQLLQQYPDSEQRLLAANRLLMAADSMDLASIHTIHGWCYRMLQEHAFASGLAFGLELCEQEGELIQELVWDYWRLFYLGLDQESLARVRELFASPSAMQQRLSPLLAEPVVDAAPEPQDWLVQHQQQWQDWNQQSRAHWLAQDWLGQLQQLFEAGAKAKAYSASKLKVNFRNGFYQRLADWLAGNELDAKLFGGKTWQHFSDPWSELWPSLTQTEGAACLQLQQLHQDWQQAQQWQQPLAQHALYWCRQQLAERKLARGWLGQQDLLHLLQQALARDSSGQLRASIIAQLPVALVDEFQDTDPIQYDIFRRLYQPQNNPDDLLLLMIGDPKQAIYGFRGADLDTYLQARDDLSQQPDRLDDNFRSSPELVEGVNAWFDRDTSLPQGSFALAGESGDPALPFFPSQGRKFQGQLWVKGQPWAANQWLWLSNPGLLVADYQAVCAQQAAWQVAELLQLSHQGLCQWRLPDESQRPLQAKDIALLVNGRTEAQLLRQGLQQLGVASVYLSDRSNVFQGWVAQELLALLRALCQPQRESLLRTALATRLLCADLQQLRQWLDDPLAWQELQDRFTRYLSLWRQQSLLPALYALLHDFGVAARLQAQIGGERQLTDLLHLAELLQQASLEHPSPEALLEHFNQRIEQAESDNQGEQQRLESELNLVKIVTIHKAKGLAYPLVILPFSLKQVKTKPNRPWRLNQGQVQLKDSTAEKQQQLEQELQEAIRKLYVALTRASSHNLMLLSEIKPGGDKALELDSAPCYLLQSPSSEPEFKDRLAQLAHWHELPCLSSPPAPLLASTWQRQDLPEIQGRLFQPWWISSYSSLPLQANGANNQENNNQGTNSEITASDSHSSQPLAESAPQHKVLEVWQEPLLAGSPEQDIQQFPRGAPAGNFFHALLEYCGQQQGSAQSGFAAALADPDGREAQLRLMLEQRQWQDWQACVSVWLQQLLSQPLALEQGPPLVLGQLQGEHCLVEMEFWLASRQVRLEDLDALARAWFLPGQARPSLKPQQLNGLLKGFIDLVIEHQGRYFVLDWKSNYLAQGYDLPQLQQCMLDKRYDLQALLYLLALHRLLKQRLKDYQPQQHLGGALYLFLRGLESPGSGLLQQGISQEQLQQLDQLFRHQELSA